MCVFFVIFISPNVNGRVLFICFRVTTSFHSCKQHSLQVSKEAKIRNQYNQVPHLHPMESDKNAIKHHTQESQEVSPFPAGDRKAAMNRQESMTNSKHE